MQAQVQESSTQGAVLSPQWLPPGTWVGRWRVERRLGSGGNGTVYEVRREQGGRGHALKLAHRPGDPRFAREAEVLRRVRHPGVVRLVEEGAWQAGRVRYPYLVQQYARGESLYDWALARNPTARQVAGLLAQVADTLAEAHRRGVLHRDFKGENTRVDVDQRLKVLDWGAGWYTDATPLTSAARLPPGTPPYHSPQAMLFCMRAQRGRAVGPYVYTEADELYAVGVTFYRLLVEQYMPLRLSEDLEASVEAPGPWAVRALNPRVPAPLAGLVHGLLAFQPEARPVSARVLAETVRRALAEAGPAWDEPLFEWYTGPAPDTRTTQAGAAPPGPVASGHEELLHLARTRALGQAQRHREVRLVRRREPARVVTLPGADSVLREARGEARAQRLAVASVALAAVVAGIWALTQWSPLPRPPPAGYGPDGRQLARPSAPADTALTAAASHLVRFTSPWPEEAMSLHEPLSCLTRLQRHLLAASAAATLTACPGVEVRPSPSNCPSEALATMRQLRMTLNDVAVILLDPAHPYGVEELGNAVLVRDGPITSRLEENVGRLPVGTLLYGRLWTGGERVFGRYTRARTPDGNEHSVCLNLGAGSEGLYKLEGSQPGYTLADPTPGIVVVDRFP